ncbi:MAG: anti-sigma factor [Acidobacteria bacterium]|nr:anti-sigma factor [Acidobacteriota bacterium]
MRHEDYKELLALEAAGALAGDESRSLSAHVETCAECRAELDELRETASWLVYTVAASAPSAGLRERVLDSVRALKTVDPSEASDVVDLGDVDAPRSATSGKETDARLSSLDEYGAWQIISARPSMMYGTLAATLVIAALAVTSGVLWNRNREMLADISRTQDELARAQEIEQIVTAPDAPVNLLAGTNEAPQARARLVYDRRTGSAVLSASNLPSAPAGKAYQLWYIAGGKPLPGVVFNTDASGRAVLRDRVPPEGRNASIFAVTLEPAGGLTAPTGAKFLLGNAS